MLNKKVSLHDIEDVEAFVIMCLKRSGANAPSEYWEELIAEGICLLYRMASNYKEQMPGYESKGRFSGYAVKWLPKQLMQAWHKSQEHHLYVKMPDGKREWKYRLTPVSYEKLTWGDEENRGGNSEIRMFTMQQWIDVPVYDE